MGVSTDDGYCNLKYGNDLSCVHTKLAYYILSVTANHILRFMSPRTRPELLPLPMYTRSLC